jgi:alcohol dehydrogenase class IV
MDESGIIGTFTFYPQERVIFGRGTVARLAPELDRLGRQRALVITGRTIATRTDLVERVRQVLGKRFAGVFYPISQHVPRRDVLAAAVQAREVEADALISLGGGSPVDGTKAVALCLSEGVAGEKELESYRVRGPRGMRSAPPFRGQPVPHIALTTTLSAGEFTSGFGITDEARRVKEGYGGAPFVPRVVILDPELTVHTPGWLWAATGMRAVDHAVERLYSPKHQPLVDTLCIQALSYLFQNLLPSTRDAQNSEARLYCQLGAWMSIFGGMSVRTGISHAIGHQLGGRCHVPHGHTSCIMLPHAMDFNLPIAADRLALVAESAGIDTRGLSHEDAAGKAIKRVEKFIRDLGCPTRLRDTSVQESDLVPLAEAVMEEIPSMENPRPIRGRDEILGLLRRAW